ncbi:MAG: DUF554 domain-containing protein [Clostridia bacterium]|nr:DUF554 domain-containing protein [Clostridia bacterium]
MPVGVMANAAASLLGGLLGCMMKKWIPQRFQDELPVVFGYCAMAIGVNSIIKAQNMAAVVMAVILGSCIGGALMLECRAKGLLRSAASRLFGPAGAADGMDQELLATVAALFCFSGFGWYGALMESLTGSAEILISKSVLDFFTAALFAVLLGRVICMLPFAQFAVLLAVYGTGRLCGALLPQAALANLSAVGGILTLATGFRVAKIKSVAIFDMVPALVLVFPLSMLL